MSNKCPGTASESAGNSEACAGCPNKSFCSEKPSVDPDIALISQNISHIKPIIAILSGKGGVGKSTISRNLSEALSHHKQKILLIDFDIAGPSIPRLTNTLESVVFESNGILYPIMINEYFYCISVGHFIDSASLAMNSKYKNMVIKKILKEIYLDNIECIVIDTPPGVSDEHLGLINYLNIEMAIIVTTPQRISLNDVRRQVDFCKKTKIAMYGLLMNMKGMICNNCGHENVLYDDCGIERFCQDNAIRYIGGIAMSQDISKKSDQGLYVEHPLFKEIAIDILDTMKQKR